MIDTIVVFCYLALILFVGLYNALKVKNSNEFNKGTHYSAIVIFCTLTASYVGGGFTMGLAEKTFKYGVVFIIAMFGFSIKEILIAVLIAPKMQFFQKNCSTAGDIISYSFGNKAKVFTGFASLLVCGGIIGAQLATCGNIFESFVSIPAKIGTLVTAIIIVTYVSLGGLGSVVKANVIHFSVLFCVIIIVFSLGILKSGGIESLIKNSPKEFFQIQGSQGYISLVVLFVSFFLGETLVPPYVQRLLIGKTKTATQRGTFYSGVVSFLIFTMVGIIGIISYLISPNIEPRFAFAFAIEELLPLGARGFGIAAMIAIIMSSADSFMNATSIAVKKDILDPIFGPPKSLKKDLFYSRVISFALGIIATCFALYSTSILDMLLYSYQFWTPFILVPLFVAIYRIRSSGTVFFLASFCSILTLVTYNMLFDNNIADGSLEGVIIATVVNLLVFLVSQKLLYRKTNLALQPNKQF